MRYKLTIDAPLKGRSRQATITVTDTGGKIVFTDHADLSSAEGRHKAALRLAAKLKRKPAPTEQRLEKAWHEALTRQQAAEEQAPASVRCADYCAEGGRLCWRKVGFDGGVTIVPLANFSARIVEEVIHDDGAEQQAALTIEGTLADGRPLPRIEVPVGEFPAMGWPIKHWGSRAVPYAGMGLKDHLRTAVQVLSGDAPRRTVFGHTGWRKVADAWVYLHAGGAIGADGPVAGVETALPDALGGYQLPLPPSGSELVRAIRASLGLLDLGADRHTFPLLAAAYRAALGGTDFSLHLSGPTGCFKTEAVALVQQHFGPGMDARHLPGSWSSTGNALEGLAFRAKDAVLVIDDFAPTGSTADVQRQHREADRILRAQGNHAGRLRMCADASLRPAKPPRGVIVSTGEDQPRGQSLRSRILHDEVSSGDINAEPLTACQRDAAAGLYAQSLTGFVRWLAPRYEQVRTRLQSEATELREAAQTPGQHARTPGIVADMLLGLRYFLAFACEAGAVTAEERAALWDRGQKAFAELADAQAATIQAAEPCALFLRLLADAIGSGRAHVASADGTEPVTPQRWGWRERTIGAGEHARDEWQPQGRRLGWVDGEDLYLMPEAAHAEAQHLAVEQGESLLIGVRTLAKRLKEKGYLASLDTQRNRLTVRKTLEGANRVVLHLRARSLSPLSTVQSGQKRPEDPKINGDLDTSFGQSVGHFLDSQELVSNGSGQKHDGNGVFGHFGQSKVGVESAMDGVKSREPGEEG
jgi:hypothetical protein